MKTTLEHLSPEIQNELNDIVEYIKNDPEMKIYMIILFGSYARGDWVSDRYTEGNITYEYESDIDLLLVMKSESKSRQKFLTKSIRQKITDRVSNNKSVSIIFHGFDYLNEQIKKKSYFFYDIYREGIILYDSGKYKLAKPKALTREQVYTEAKNHFKKWFSSANKFFKGYYFYLEEGEKDFEDYNLAIFNLHQATERYYTAILLVFTNYKKKTHDLFELNRMSCEEEERFKEVFPRKTEEEKRLFTLLRDAYIDSRYDMEYKVEKFELEYLESRVKFLKELAEKICNDKIEEFRLIYEEGLK